MIENTFLVVKLRVAHLTWFQIAQEFQQYFANCWRCLCCCCITRPADPTRVRDDERMSAAERARAESIARESDRAVASGDPKSLEKRVMIAMN
jgi:hypothetical protein